MNKKDLATAEAIIEEANSWGFIFTHNKEDEVREMIYAALTTARKEAREAAFKQCAGLATMMAAGETFETGRQKALNIAAAIEAAANTEEGGGDG